MTERSVRPGAAEERAARGWRPSRGLVTGFAGGPRRLVSGAAWAGLAAYVLFLAALAT